MLDGAANLSTLFYGLFGNRLYSLDIGSNMLDGGAPYYQVYETLDGKFVAVGAIEERFYAELLEGLGINPSALPDRNDTQKWPEMIAQFAGVFKTRTRDEWGLIFGGKDACVTPILELDEVGEHPHNKERGLLVSVDGFFRPAPAPRLILGRY
jgi:alpha-methylacyl-CoA racemase